MLLYPEEMCGHCGRKWKHHEEIKGEIFCRDGHYFEHMKEKKWK